MDEMNIELYEKLSRLQRLMHQQHLRKHAENGPMAAPARGQRRIFALLKMQDSISTKDMSYLLGIRVPSLNGLPAMMEKNGDNTREPSENDKRVMLVKLTEEEQTAFASAPKRVHELRGSAQELPQNGKYLQDAAFSFPSQRSI